MHLHEFWAIVERAGSPRALHDELDKLPEEDLVGFERQHDACVDRSYDWGLWGAAYVINGGCSDDTFEYFRAFLISRGRDVFERALADPDSLASVDVGAGEEWEDWMSPTMSVVHARTGRYAFAGPPDPGRTRQAQPSGQEWDEDDLPDRFPRLARKYGL